MEGIAGEVVGGGDGALEEGDVGVDGGEEVGAEGGSATPAYTVSANKGDTHIHCVNKGVTGGVRSGRAL